MLCSISLNCQRYILNDFFSYSDCGVNLNFERFEYIRKIEATFENALAC